MHSGSNGGTRLGGPSSRLLQFILLRKLDHRRSPWSVLVNDGLFFSSQSTDNNLDKYLTDMQKVAIYFHMINCVFIWGASLVGWVT